MGMYTEFYFRADIKDGDAADWLDKQINGDEAEWFESEPQTPLKDHALFTTHRWRSVFIGGGSVSHESRSPTFYGNRLVLSSSLKNYDDEIENFINWITPHLKMFPGEYLGYSLYEDSTDDSKDYRDHPTLYFANREEVRA